MLATFLADKEVGLRKEEGKLRLDQNAFAEWLDEKGSAFDIG